MKIEVTRKQLLTVLLIIALALVAGFAVGTRGVISFAAATNPGHGAEEVGPGDFAEGIYEFPGTSQVGIGTAPTNDLDVAGKITANTLDTTGKITANEFNICYCIEVQCAGGTWNGGPRCNSFGNWTGLASCGGNDEDVQIKLYKC